MKRELRLAQAIFRGSGIARSSVVYMAIAMLIVLLSDRIKSGDLVTICDVIGGIKPSIVVGDIDYIALSRWLLLLFAPLLCIGQLIDKTNSLITYSVLRVGGYRHMWRLTQLSVIGHVVSYVGLFAGISLAYVLAIGEKDIDHLGFLLMMVLILAQMSMLCCVSSWICEKYKNPAPGFLLIVFTIGLTYMLAQYFPLFKPYAIGAWGMYLERRTAEQPHGYLMSIAILTQLALTICACLIPPRRSLY
ncbi:MAG: hypothetical protein RSD95_14240 [Clostridia bacterium]